MTDLIAMLKRAIFFSCLLLCAKLALAQTCTNIGQTPESAFPACGTAAFIQNNVPICGNTNIPVPCNDGALYQNKNPYWYKFTCYASGTLGFTITPNDLTDDYDWQIFDVTGHNPADVFTDATLFVACNWSGEVGETGASSAGSGLINCAGSGIPLFSAMPTLIVGHEYLLLVSHFTNSQSGYQLVFDGGTAVITDSVEPALLAAKISCDGTTIQVRFNKKMRCSSLAADGSDFMIGGNPATIVSASSQKCNTGFDTDTAMLLLSTPLGAGTYNLVAQNGSDGNSLLDICSRSIPLGNSVQFTVAPAQPTPMDSIRPVGCAPNKLQLVFNRPIICTSIAANGSDFTITGPQPVTISQVLDSCRIGRTGVITIVLAAPITSAGVYQIHLQTGSDGNTLIDECGRQTPAGATLSFTTVDTVNADFSYSTAVGCKNDTLSFTHDGQHNVSSWNWVFDNTGTSTSQNVMQIWSASSQHTVKLTVSNGLCKDSSSQTVVLDNKVVAAFDVDAVICPEDSLKLTNNSTGLIDSWQWTFGNGNTSSLQDPPPQQYPITSREATYTIRLIASSSSLGCKDSASKTIRVLGNCFIAVPSAFTPNGDGLNDFLYPLNALKADNLEFRIYNRVGQLVFESHDWQKKWDGKINGVTQGTGVYVWFLRFTHHDTGKKVFMKGTTVLIR